MIHVHAGAHVAIRKDVGGRGQSQGTGLFRADRISAWPRVTETTTRPGALLRTRGRRISRLLEIRPVLTAEKLPQNLIGVRRGCEGAVQSGR